VHIGTAFRNAEEAGLGDKFSDFMMYHATPGSKSPGRVPIVTPPAGVKPMLVSMLFFS